jgi:hypothetical protein
MPSCPLHFFSTSALSSLLLAARNLFSSAFQKSDGIEDEMKDKLQKFRGSEAAPFHFLFLLRLPLCPPVTMLVFADCWAKAPARKVLTVIGKRSQRNTMPVCSQ